MWYTVATWAAIILLKSLFLIGFHSFIVIMLHISVSWMTGDPVSVWLTVCHCRFCQWSVCLVLSLFKLPRWTQSNPIKPQPQSPNEADFLNVNLLITSVDVFSKLQGEYKCKMPITKAVKIGIFNMTVFIFLGVIQIKISELYAATTYWLHG